MSRLAPLVPPWLLCSKLLINLFRQTEQGPPRSGLRPGRFSPTPPPLYYTTSGVAYILRAGTIGDFSLQRLGHGFFTGSLITISPPPIYRQTYRWRLRFAAKKFYATTPLLIDWEVQIRRHQAEIELSTVSRWRRKLEEFQPRSPAIMERTYFIWRYF